MAAAAAVSQPTVVVKNKGLLTLAIMVAVIMQVLDTTIANVALPHMRASLGASQDEINWVLTSYIVAAAIATPLTGWFSDRLGRHNLMLIAVVGFTGASLLCGIATSLVSGLVAAMGVGSAPAVLGGTMVALALMLAAMCFTSIVLTFRDCFEPPERAAPDNGNDADTSAVVPPPPAE